MIKKFALVAFLLGTPSLVEAAPILVEYTGHVYEVSNSVAGRFSLGALVQGSFVYESSDAGQAWYPGGVIDSAFRYYPDAPIVGSLTVDGYTVTYGASSRMFVSDNEANSNGLIDRIIFDDYGADAVSVAGLPFYTTFLNWQNWGGTAISGLEMPSDQSVFDRFESRAGVIDWGYTNDGANRITFFIEDVHVTSVPEPAIWVSMISGLLIMGCCLRLSGKSPVKVRAKNRLIRRTSRP